MILQINFFSPPQLNRSPCRFESELFYVRSLAQSPERLLFRLEPSVYCYVKWTRNFQDERTEIRNPPSSLLSEPPLSLHLTLLSWWSPFTCPHRSLPRIWERRRRGLPFISSPQRNMIHLNELKAINGAMVKFGKNKHKIFLSIFSKINLSGGLAFCDVIIYHSLICKFLQDDVT